MYIFQNRSNSTHKAGTQRKFNAHIEQPASSQQKKNTNWVYLNTFYFKISNEFFNTTNTIMRTKLFTCDSEASKFDFRIVFTQNEAEEKYFYCEKYCLCVSQRSLFASSHWIEFFFISKMKAVCDVCELSICELRLMCVAASRCMWEHASANTWRNHYNVLEQLHYENAETAWKLI